MEFTYRELVRQGFGFTNLNYTAVFSYDAAGRLVREGDKTYRYGYLDKVLSVTDGKRSYRYAYHVDGQLARADYGDGGRAGSLLPAGSEAFHWDGLALVRRGDERFVNEPHAGDAPKKLRSGGKPRAKRSARRARKGPRGNPVVSSKGVAYLNDALGTTVGARRGARYSAAALTAFGEGGGRHAFFTGKPLVEGLGRAFLMRNYRADLAKWQTADPLGYPDGWNPFAYCKLSPTVYVDYAGGRVTCVYSISSRKFTMDDGSLHYEVYAISGDNVIAHQWDMLGPAPIGSWSIMNDPKEFYFQLWYDGDTCFDDVARKGQKSRQNIRLTVNSVSHGCVCLDDNDAKSFDIIQYIKNTNYVMKRNGADNKLYRCFGTLTVTE